MVSYKKKKKNSGQLQCVPDVCLFKIEAKGILECGRKRNEPLMHVFMQKYYCGRGPSPLAWSGVVIA